MQRLGAIIIHARACNSIFRAIQSAPRARARAIIVALARRNERDADNRRSAKRPKLLIAARAGALSKVNAVNLGKVAYR